MFEQFLRTICEAPEDDTPRLICADWLEESGQPERAEFIRLQCEIARSPCGHEGWQAVRNQKDGSSGLNCRTCALACREWDLLYGRFDGYRQWSLFVGTDAMQVMQKYRRGFVERLLLPGDLWTQLASAATARAPIREVMLSTLPTVERRMMEFSRHMAFRLAGMQWAMSIPLPLSDRQEEWRQFGAEHGEIANRLLANYWPRIEFDLSLVPHNWQMLGVTREKVATIGPRPPRYTEHLRRSIT